MIRRAQRIAAAVGAVALIAVAAGCGGTDCDSYRFDGAAWNRHDGIGSSPRAKLAEGLVDCGWLTGKTRREIRAGLGRPWSRDDSGSWTYAIGSAPMQSEPDLLEIHFDRDERVRKARIVR